jgi:octaprenyl-diphosphate synthase
LNTIDKKTRREIIYIVKNKNQDKEKVNWVINKVKEAGGIAYATEKMNEYKKDALNILQSFPENEARKGLENLVLYVTDRKY